jgi:hypothetical protein
MKRQFYFVSDIRVKTKYEKTYGHNRGRFLNYEKKGYLKKVV